MAVPPSVMAVSVVRAWTASPGVLRVESTGLRTALTDDPLARFALASSGCEAPAALPGRSGAAANPAHSPHARRSSVIEFLPRHRGPSIVDGARPGCFGRPSEGSTWNRADRSGPERPPMDAQP